MNAKEEKSRVFFSHSFRAPIRVARFFLAQCTKTVKNIPNYHHIYQMSIKYFKWPYNRPNVYNMYQHLPLQDPPKFTESGIFGMKICHLATLARITVDAKCETELIR
jgi:hypothetical protein